MNNSYVLTNEENTELFILQKQLEPFEPFKQMVEFANKAKELSNFLPLPIRIFLDKFKEGKLKDDIVLFKNLPIPENIQTPENNLSHLGESTILARCQALFNQYTGNMLSYEAEGKGHLFQDMVPNHALKNTQTSLGSAIELELHTEQAFSPLKPDYLCLGCIRGDKQAKTYFLHVDAILTNLSTEYQACLKDELWTMGIDLSFILNGCNANTRGPIAIYNNNELIFDQDLMNGVSEKADIIKQEIINIYLTHRKHIILEKGDLLFINNRKIVHGRSPFLPKFNGEDRFIIRSFICNDLDRVTSSFEQGTYIVKTKYS